MSRVARVNRTRMTAREVIRDRQIVCQLNVKQDIPCRGIELERFRDILSRR
jgi:hypothetical protein